MSINKVIPRWKKEKHDIKCHKCGYKWKTTSLMGYVSCPYCNNKVLNPKAELKL